MIQNRTKRASRKNRGFVQGLLLFFICLLSGCGKEAAVFVAGESSELEDASGCEAAKDLQEEGETEPREETTDHEEWVVVHVCGQVETPGVYRLEPGSRVGDAVALAGGMTEDAATDALNLAQVLEDAQMIRVPSKEEAKSAYEGLAGTAFDDRGRISLNHATKEQLMTLPGIGEAKADAILAYRLKQGRFERIEEIMNIPGIKEGLFSRVKDRITV